MTGTCSHVPTKTSTPLRPLNPRTRLVIPPPRHGASSMGFLLVGNTSPGDRVDEGKLLFFIEEEVTVRASRTGDGGMKEKGVFDCAKLQRDYS